MECPRCGYVMGPFDAECERCRRMGPPPEPEEEQEAATAPQSEPDTAPTDATQRDTAPRIVTIGPWISESGQHVWGNLGMAIVMMLITIVPFLFAYLIVWGGILAHLPPLRIWWHGTLLIAVILAIAFLSVVMPALYVGILSCFWDMVRRGRLSFDHIMAGVPMWLSALGLWCIFMVMSVIAGTMARMIPILGPAASVAVPFPLPRGSAWPSSTWPYRRWVLSGL